MPMAPCQHRRHTCECHSCANSDACKSYFARRVGENGRWQKMGSKQRGLLPLATHAASTALPPAHSCCRVPVGARFAGRVASTSCCSACRVDSVDFVCCWLILPASRQAGASWHSPPRTRRSTRCNGSGRRGRVGERHGRPGRPPSPCTARAAGCVRSGRSPAHPHRAVRGHTGLYAATQGCAQPQPHLYTSMGSDSWWILVDHAALHWLHLTAPTLVSRSSSQLTLWERDVQRE